MFNHKKIYKLFVVLLALCFAGLQVFAEPLVGTGKKKSSSNQASSSTEVMFQEWFDAIRSGEIERSSLSSDEKELYDILNEEFETYGNVDDLISEIAKELDDEDFEESESNLVVVDNDDVTDEEYDSSSLEDIKDDFYLLDQYGLLTENEYFALNERLEEISLKYDMGIYVIIINDFNEYGSSVESVAEKIYDEFGLGVGSERSMLELLLSMKDRSFDIDAHGFGCTAFDSKKSRLIDAFKDNFSSDDWYGGLNDYVNEAEKILYNDSLSGVDYATRQQQIDKENKSTVVRMAIIIFIVLAMIIGGIRLACERAKMKNVKEATQADSYVDGEGADYTENRDVYLYSTTTTRIIESSSRSGGGDGGHSHSSGHF